MGPRDVPSQGRAVSAPSFSDPFWIALLLACSPIFSLSGPRLDNRRVNVCE